MLRQRIRRAGLQPQLTRFGGLRGQHIVSDLHLWFLHPAQLCAEFFLGTLDELAHVRLGCIQTIRDLRVGIAAVVPQKQYRAVTRRQCSDSGRQSVALGETLDLGGRRGSDIFLGKRQDIAALLFAVQVDCFVLSNSDEQRTRFVTPR